MSSRPAVPQGARDGRFLRSHHTRQEKTMTTRPTGPACGNNPNHPLTDGDRQAVDSFRAYLANRVALRDRIAAAIWERQNPGRRWADCEYRWRADAEEDADAVLAVLPEPVDQASAFPAVRPHTLTSIACHLDARAVAIMRPDSQTYAEWQTVADELRRMAAETPAAEAQRPERKRLTTLATPCAVCTHPYNWHCGRSACEFGSEENLCGCRSFTPGEEPAAGARQDGEDQ